MTKTSVRFTICEEEIVGEVVSEDEEVTVGAQHQENKDEHHNVEVVMVIFLEGFVEVRRNKLVEEGEESAISFCK